MKIAMIEESFLRTGENLLYADSDTFFTADPTQLFKQVSPSAAFMHTHEYVFGDVRQSTDDALQLFLNLLESTVFKLADGSSLRVGFDQSSWNAGVMFFHSSHAALLKDVYALTDQFYPCSRSHASEQYAFSIIFQNNTALQSCEGVIYHYWYRIKKRIADIFLPHFFNAKWFALPLDGRLASVAKATAKLPSYFDRHILTVRDNSIQAFHENRFAEGMKEGALAIFRTPFYFPFIRDYMYHIKRLILNIR